MDLHTLQQYIRGPKTTIILRLHRRPTIHISTLDLREVLSHGEPIYQEPLILSLEVIHSKTECKYIEPVFFSLLQHRGSNSVKRWFGTTLSPHPDKPSLDDIGINIPVHINGNHWVGLHRKNTGGKVQFFYADDLI
jgi:hypothetical protein